MTCDLFGTDIIWTIADLLCREPQGTNLNEIWSKYNNYHSRILLGNIVYKMSAILFLPQPLDRSCGVDNFMIQVVISILRFIYVYIHHSLYQHIKA